MYILGMLSKSKGQILRTAAVLHVLFEMENQSEEHDSNDISPKAMVAAIDFVQTSVQHTAYIAGKDTIASEVEKAETGTCMEYKYLLLSHCVGGLKDKSVQYRSYIRDII